MSTMRRALAVLTAAATIPFLATVANAQKTLRFVPHSDLKILDPIWTTAYVVRNHGYMVYDTLRSEEHTSELQSRFDLVCRLLLEKKKSRN